MGPPGAHLGARQDGCCGMRDVVALIATSPQLTKGFSKPTNLEAMPVTDPLDRAIRAGHGRTSSTDIVGPCAAAGRRNTAESITAGYQ